MRTSAGNRAGGALHLLHRRFLCGNLFIVMNDRKKFYRSRSERMIAGVCGGMSDYLGMDPVLVRVLWVVITLTFGAGLLAYVLFWLLAPEEPAAA